MTAPSTAARPLRASDAARIARGGSLAARHSRLAIALPPVALFLFAFAIRAVLAVLHPDPAYPDSAYYVDVARNVAAGKGFNVDFLWTFIEVGGRIPADPHLPVPSNPHWAPLASIVQVPFIWALGPTQLASLLPFALVGALGAPLAWAIARDAGAAPLVQAGAGFLGAVPGLATVFMAQQDNFGITMVLGGAAMWATSRGLRGHPWSFVASGVLVGLAALARTDGLLLAAGPAAAVAWDRWSAWRAGHGAGAEHGSRAGHGSGAGHGPGAARTSRAGHGSGERRRPAIPAAAVLGCIAGFLAIVGPWWIRQLAVFGSLSPSTNAGILWLRSFAELDSVTAPRTLAAFLAQPLGDLVGSRVGGWADALVVYGVIVCAIALVPFVFAGTWRRRGIESGPALAAAAVLFAVSGLLFAIHVPNGMFLHASVAFAPHTYWLAMEGIVGTAGWFAARTRRPGASHVPATRAVVDARGPARAAVADRVARLTAVGVLAIVAAGAALSAVSVGNAWENRLGERRQLAQAVEALAAPGDRLMSVDAATFRYLTGHGGIVTPDDPLAVVEQAARAYDVRWLVLERDGAVASLEPLLDGTAHRDWVGPPAYVLPATANGRASVAAAIFPLCFHAGQPGCTPGGVALLPATALAPAGRAPDTGAP